MLCSYHHARQRSESDVKRIVSLLRLFKGFKDKFSTEAQEEFGRSCEYTWYLKFKCIKATYVFFMLKRRVLTRAGQWGNLLFSLLWICFC